MGSTPLRQSPKELIAANIVLLMQLYHKSRKEVCRDLDIRYTTFCDWVKARTYPRIDNLDRLGYYFRIETREFFVDIAGSENIMNRIRMYAEKYGVRMDEEPAMFTVEDYNETPDGYPVELINGQFYTMESPTARHQRIVCELGYVIGAYIKKNKGKCLLFPGPFDVELPTQKPTVVAPDLTIICNRDLLNEKRCVGAPDWIIEILSVSTAEKDMRVKLQVYEESGVREYWIVDQFKDEVAVYHLKEGIYNLPKTYVFSDTIPVGIYDDFSICMADLDLEMY